MFWTPEWREWMILRIFQVSSKFLYFWKIKWEKILLLLKNIFENKFCFISPRKKSEKKIQGASRSFQSHPRLKKKFIRFFLWKFEIFVLWFLLESFIFQPKIKSRNKSEFSLFLSAMQYFWCIVMHGISLLFWLEFFWRKKFKTEKIFWLNYFVFVI